MPGPYFPDPAAEAVRNPAFSEVSSQDATGNVLERLAYMIANPTVVPMPPLVSVLSPQSMGTILISMGCVAPVSAVWPAANETVIIPVVVTQPITITKLWVFNGAAVSGNIDIGIYSDAAAPVLVVAAGSTVQAGTSIVQEFNIADTALAPGRYYIAVVLDNTTGTTIRVAAPAIGTQAENFQYAGLAQMAAAFPLPATLTLAASSRSYLPICGFAVLPRTLVT